MVIDNHDANFGWNRAVEKAIVNELKGSLHEL